MRGDRPLLQELKPEGNLFTPHARGSTAASHSHHPIRWVYPACAGIDLQTISLSTSINSLPRMRGDRPFAFSLSIGKEAFTPHARGSTSCRFRSSKTAVVYPACAGIDPQRGGRRMRNLSLPRMRGDRPCRGSTATMSSWFTPHARGSTNIRRNHLHHGGVYPACAGIDRH